MMTPEADEYLMHRRRRPEGVPIDQLGELGYLCPRLHGGPALDWSEWQEHLWCYECGIDWESSKCPKMRPAGISDDIWERMNKGLPFKPVVLPGNYPWTNW